MKSLKVLSAVLAVSLIAGVMAGCGGFSGNQSAETEKAQVQNEQGKPPMKSEQILALSTNFEIKTLVPWAASENNAFMVNNQAQEGLFRMDAKHKPQYALCSSMDLSADKLTYTFHLRDGIKWSNGDPITANDFVFAWLQQMSSKATNGYSFIMTDYIVNGAEYNAGKAEKDAVGVKALDDKTLEVKIKTPTPYFINLTSMIMFFPVNEKFYNEKGDKFALTPDTMLFSGPYVITEFDPAVGVTFKKNDLYWDKDNVKVENAKIRVIKDASAALSAYQADELSVVQLSSSDVMANKDNPNFVNSVDFRTTYIQFNLTDPIMQNADMRKAVSFAINRETLVQSILADGSIKGSGLIADGMSGDAEKTFRELNGKVSYFDAAKAKEHYDKAVATLGKAPEAITLLVTDDSVMKTVATYIQSDLEKNLGVKVNIDTKTVQGRGALMDANTYQFAITAWGADYDDAMTYLDLWVNGTHYRGNYNDEAYNKLIADAKAQTDDAVRLKDMLEAEKKLVEEDMVVSPLYFRGTSLLVKPNVKGLINHPIGVPVEFKTAYFE